MSWVLLHGIQQSQVPGTQVFDLGHNNCMEQYRLGENDWKIAMTGH